MVQRCVVENVPPDFRWLNKTSTHKANRFMFFFPSSLTSQTVLPRPAKHYIYIYMYNIECTNPTLRLRNRAGKQRTLCMMPSPPTHERCVVRMGITSRSWKRSVELICDFLVRGMALRSLFLMNFGCSDRLGLGNRGLWERGSLEIWKFGCSWEKER